MLKRKRPPLGSLVSSMLHVCMGVCMSHIIEGDVASLSPRPTPSVWAGCLFSLHGFSLKMEPGYYSTILTSLRDYKYYVVLLALLL